MLIYESMGQGLILVWLVFPPFQAGQLMGAWGNLVKVNYGNSDDTLILCPVGMDPTHHRIKGLR